MSVDGATKKPETQLAPTLPVSVCHCIESRSPLGIVWLTDWLTVRLILHVTESLVECQGWARLGPLILSTKTTIKCSSPALLHLLGTNDIHSIHSADHGVCFGFLVQSIWFIALLCFVVQCRATIVIISHWVKAEGVNVGQSSWSNKSSNVPFNVRHW